ISTGTTYCSTPVEFHPATGARRKETCPAGAASRAIGVHYALQFVLHAEAAVVIFPFQVEWLPGFDRSPWGTGPDHRLRKHPVEAVRCGIEVVHDTVRIDIKAEVCVRVRGARTHIASRLGRSRDSSGWDKHTCYQRDCGTDRAERGAASQPRPFFFDTRFQCYES